MKNNLLILMNGLAASFRRTRNKTTMGFVYKMYQIFFFYFKSIRIFVLEILILLSMKNIFLPLLLLAAITVSAANETIETLGIQTSTVSAFPNPANDKLVINVSTPTANAAITIKIYDVLGKIVMQKGGVDTDGVGKSNNVIDVNEFFPGIYTIVVSEGGGSTTPPLRFMVAH